MRWGRGSFAQASGRLENRSHPIFEAMRPERTCLHAVRSVILNALLKSIELEVQF